jgi:hypothetical protein
MGPVMNHVGEFPVEAVMLRIAPFAAEGESRFLVPVNDERVEVRYVAEAGAQRVELGPSRVRFDVEVLGGPAGPIDLVRSS